jgi:hypothetical protein
MHMDVLVVHNTQLSYSFIAPWFLFRPCHIFPDSGLGGIHENFISPSSCALYIYMCACISFWLISLYLWLALIFLFIRVYYGFTPLWHRTSWHYMSRQWTILIIMTHLHSMELIMNNTNCQKELEWVPAWSKRDHIHHYSYCKAAFDQHRLSSDIHDMDNQVEESKSMWWW